MSAPQLTNEEIDQRFTYHGPRSDGDVQQHEAARALVRHVAEHFNDLLPAGRETALAMTHLEEALFWGNAAIARARSKG